MTDVIILETDRLKLRQWKKKDWPIFADINSDPVVMKFFPSTLTEKESNAFAKKLQALISKRGWGLWTVEVKQRKQFIGFVGLHQSLPELSFSPCIEIGWRLAKKFWGNGYALEAAKEALKVGFEILDLDEVYSFTSIKNLKSIAVMKRLKFQDTLQNFEHPNVPMGNSLREHVLYTITKMQWQKNIV